MSVTITWSLSAGGSAEADIAHGNSSNGSNTTSKRIFLKHDGVNSITGCAFYFVQKSGSYSGDFTAADDFTELLEWGDGADADAFGGIQVNMDAINSFSGGSTWGMDFSQKTSVDGLKFTARTGVANSLANAFTLSKNMSSSMSVDGEIPTGLNDASFELRIKVPVDEGTAGARQFGQVLKYTSTS
jgi:hypothetical protein